MDIKISRSAHRCAACECDFVHEQDIRSVAKRTEEGLERQDFCPDCYEPALGRKAFSVWAAHYHDPQAAEQEPPEAFSPLRRLFYDAVEAEDRLELAKAFLAAQLLRRQKVFRLIKESDDSDGEVKLLLYSDRIGERLIEVRDPQFSYTELDAARVRLVSELQALEQAEQDAQQAAEAPENPQATEKPAEPVTEASPAQEDAQQEPALEAAEEEEPPEEESEHAANA